MNPCITCDYCKPYVEFQIFGKQFGVNYDVHDKS